MNQQEIFKNMTKGEWKPSQHWIFREGHGGQIAYVYNTLEPEMKEYSEKDKEGAANRVAISSAVNNTYGKGINPESVERFKKFAETFFNYYSSMEYQLNWDKLAEEHTGGNVDFIAWATGEAQDILFNSRLEAPKIKNHE